MKVHGSCHCGAIRLEADIDPGRVTVCHCTDCQQLTGTAFRLTVGCPERDFAIVAGEPRIYVKVADSGNRRLQAFCGDCGSNLYATSDEPPGNRIIGVRIGTLAERRDLPPARQLWCDSALPWLPGLPGEARARE